MGTVEEIAKVHHEGLIEEFKSLWINADIDYDHLEALWKERIWEKDNLILTHKNEKGKVVGFLATYKDATMLYVDKDYQRQGIGKKLLEDSKVDSVWVMMGNNKAEWFYKSQGFEPAESRVVIKFGLGLTEVNWVKNGTA